MKIKFIRTHPHAKLPVLSSNPKIGYDLFSCEGGVVMPWKRKSIRTGIKIFLPKNFCGRIYSDYHLSASKCIDICNNFIDNSSNEEVKILLINNCDEPYFFWIDDLIAKICFGKINQIKMIETIDQNL